MTLRNQKVYQGVLQQIRSYIEIHHLNPGDKLPSERELAEKLQASRSSIREALRALELLGIIETSPGEGTFLSSYRSLQSVEILASFILREKEIKGNLILSKHIIEKEAAKAAFLHITDTDILKLEEIIHNPSSLLKDKHRSFFRHLFMKADIILLERIWSLMEEFSSTLDEQVYDKSLYIELIQIYENKTYSTIEDLFMKRFKRK
ncbi:FadR family transcriptional regulator [Oceanobacillus bengalensis]|uniref:FadR family transcriptional regulator n=1 Tax=Oceanobacillus bengalensis TaxID=1435466 RepID=A0A494YXN1_9BACI|nr:FadR family transcriptional regulator [Oceanobacillus bengalensis]